MTAKNIGSVIIVASPSGGGKTSLVKKMASSLQDIEISVSHTTRAIRPREQEGLDYFFITEPEFLAMIKKKAFVEYAQVYNHYYGTSFAQVQKRLEQGIDVVLDIDWQGAQQIRKIFPQAISIFIIPPSLTILEERLQNRRQDDEQVIGLRMRRAQDELSHFEEFDYLIVNDDFDKAAEELKAIVIANRLGKTRQMAKLAKLLSFLLTPQ